MEEADSVPEPWADSDVASIEELRAAELEDEQAVEEELRVERGRWRHSRG